MELSYQFPFPLFDTRKPCCFSRFRTISRPAIRVMNAALGRLAKGRGLARHWSEGNGPDLLPGVVKANLTPFGLRKRSSPSFALPSPRGAVGSLSPHPRAGRTSGHHSDGVALACSVWKHQPLNLIRSEVVSAHASLLCEPHYVEIRRCILVPVLASFMANTA